MKHSPAVLNMPINNLHAVLYAISDLWWPLSIYTSRYNWSEMAVYYCWHTPWLVWNDVKLRHRCLSRHDFSEMTTKYNQWSRLNECVKLTLKYTTVALCPSYCTRRYCPQRNSFTVMSETTLNFWTTCRRLEPYHVRHDIKLQGSHERHR